MQNQQVPVKINIVLAELTIQ